MLEYLLYMFGIFSAFRRVECDLNINNSVGIRNTHLLKYYANSKSYYHILILFENMIDQSQTCRHVNSL